MNEPTGKRAGAAAPGRPVARTLSWVALVVAALPGSWPAKAETADRELGSEPPPEAAERRLAVFPEGHLSALPIADPHRPGAAMTMESHSSTEIEGASDRRFFLRVGGRFGLLRWSPETAEGRSWQLSLEAGLDAQFDIELGQDNIGWDGNYGLSLTSARGGGRWAFLLGILHTSAHIGDEWITRIGRQRINYTREEARAGLSWRFARRWRTYAEGAYGYKRRAVEDLMEPLRGQWGLELEGADGLLRGRAGWYAALDVQAWQERDWRLDAALQAGLRLATGNRTWRLGLQYYDGRVPLGEFFQETESAWSLGLWSEL